MDYNLGRKKEFIKSPLFFLILFEIVVGGSGRLINIGAISIKMIFFVLALIVCLFSIKVFKKSILYSVQVYFFLLSFFSLSMGLFNGADLELIFEDIKPLMFFLIINYFLITINNLNDVLLIHKIIKKGSLLMGIAYIGIVVLLNIGVLNPILFYEEQTENSEVFFRTETMFFYKGFLYLGIGFFFYFTSEKGRDKLLGLLVFIALCLSLTRGFILMAGIVLIYYIYMINKNRKLRFFTSILIGLFLVYIIPLLVGELGDKIDSDLTRFVMLDEVLSSMNLFSFFVGHGFGVGIPSREIHMEISFLEIFHKQGIIGLLFWFYLIYIVVSFYKKLFLVHLKRLALPFVLGVFFVYMQSLTNPFVNNPIGISMICLSLVVMEKLIVIQKNHVNS